MLVALQPCHLPVHQRGARGGRPWCGSDTAWLQFYLYNGSAGAWRRLP